jgi:hypothetical protein
MAKKVNESKLGEDWEPDWVNGYSGEAGQSVRLKPISQSSASRSLSERSDAGVMIMPGSDRVVMSWSSFFSSNLLSI